MADEAVFDKAKAKAFTQLMVRHLEGAAVSIMLEVGRRVGLFEAMAQMDAVTSAEIAAKTGLSERYVREWLAAMVCGGIVEYVAGDRTYRLPREHAAGLTGSSSRNLTGMAEMFPFMYWSNGALSETSVDSYIMIDRPKNSEKFFSICR